MRFAGLFSFFYLFAGVLATSVLLPRYIIILKPWAILDDFIATLEQGGNIWVVRRYESNAWFYGAVISTQSYNLTTLRKFPEVLAAEEDRIITIDPIPGPAIPLDG
ncbi:hypothetical protein CPLU01_10558 [Colletotrichum plurivorum]|uniref:Uncharacterized protein n=1 Tax=Colletotrichum plurivorum TaxID=2175906 RepID=A0A8H6N9U8_9PEZI|nr:hypothetical protein CPLU01_10558 [Colletotrichum plurivorum]